VHSAIKGPTLDVGVVILFFVLSPFHFYNFLTVSVMAIKFMRLIPLNQERRKIKVKKKVCIERKVGGRTKKGRQISRSSFGITSLYDWFSIRKSGYTMNI
jgi:hypothetical protein